MGRARGLPWLVVALALPGPAAPLAAAECWQLPIVNRVRFQPRPGQEAAMVGGTIQGSNDSATNGYVVLATITAPPPAGRFTDLRFPNPTRYRYVKYYGPPGSHGQIAELEFYAGEHLVVGEPFGTASSRSGRPWQNALDGDPATFFDGPTPDNVYVGLDLGAGHAAAIPRFSPPPALATQEVAVVMASATPGATIRFTTDGSDPTGRGKVYSRPEALPQGATTLRAVAEKECMLPSAVAVGHYAIGRRGVSWSSLHIGNSLTDSIDGYLQPLAASGGIDLDYHRFTVPGAGTYVHRIFPTKGFGDIPDILEHLPARPYDHISVQPGANMPCLPSGYASEPQVQERSDAVNIGDVWDLAVTANPKVQIWLFATWPGPTAYSNCLTGGGWLRDIAIWNPPAPRSWEDGVRNTSRFNEAVRTALVRAYPARPPPRIVPGGLGLVKLKTAVEAGRVPRVAPDGFWKLVFQQGRGSDDHLTREGRYFVSLVFYACLFEREPRGLTREMTRLDAAQADAFQAIAWQAARECAAGGAR